jgi:2-amino-4-hydroxy-6-hydroxymethyldihydropteridine diphosphokinase
VVVGLGANLGDRLAALRSAVERIAALDEVTIRGRSSVYETRPVSAPGPDYLNAAVLLTSGLEPVDLMTRLLAIEVLMGRERGERNAPRTIDLDVLWIDGVTVVTEALLVPHPRLTERAFALAPLLDLVPDARDPVTQRAYADVLCDRSALRPFADL